MNIGFDAKRVYQNNTGLGHYSRTLVSSLAKYFPGNEYFLFAPKKTTIYQPALENIHTITPHSFPSSLLKSAWRSKWVVKDILENKIDLFHGLSHEIPVGINATKTASVVTIHDLIFERYPEQYKKIDIAIYRRKFKYACKHADAIIAISEQTKQDLVDIYQVDQKKINVCYQACNPIFATQVNDEEKKRIRTLYDLPQQYFLNVGSVIERKNLLTICKALKIVQQKINIPLVVIGAGSDYKNIVLKYLEENQLRKQVIFLNEHPQAKTEAGFKDSSHFPAIFQMAKTMIYPSTFEGFGLPVLEALLSEVPVITSNVSCMPETGGDAALYCDPFDETQMALHMYNVATDTKLVNKMKERGRIHAEKFSPENCANAVMDVYLKSVRG